MLHRRTFSAVAAAAAVTHGAPAWAQAPIDITWWHAMSGQLGAALDEVVGKFNASQSRFRVVAVNKGNYVATLNAAIAAYRAGEQPVMLQNNESGVLTMMLSGAIVPAHDILDQHGVKVEVNDFLRPVIDTYTDAKGRLLAMPFNSSTPILFYNADILEKAGIAKPPATWQAMEEQIRAIKAKGAGEIGYSFAAGPWQELENYSVWHDLPFATKENGFLGLDAELTINRTRVVQHIERLARWTREGIASFGAASKATWASGARTAFLEGKAAFWIDSTAWHGTVEEGAKMRWGGAPLPHEADIAPNRSMIGGAAIYTFKGHKPEHYEGVAAFFRFLTDTDLQVSYHQATGYVPITVAAWKKAKDAGYYTRFPSREIAVTQLLQGRNTPNSRTIRLGNFENVRAAIEEELDKVWSGQATVQAALDEGVRKGNAILRRFEAANRGKL
jgi:sn-glycerol 3-phosphate transport system substrate-binding protein